MSYQCIEHVASIPTRTGLPVRCRTLARYHRRARGHTRPVLRCLCPGWLVSAVARVDRNRLSARRRPSVRASSGVSRNSLLRPLPTSLSHQPIPLTTGPVVGVMAMSSPMRQMHSPRSVVGQFEQWRHASPRIPSIPSFAMMGAMMSAATGSAHHKPNRAFKSSPPRRMADR